MFWHFQNVLLGCLVEGENVSMHSERELKDPPDSKSIKCVVVLPVGLSLVNNDTQER